MRTEGDERATSWRVRTRARRRCAGVNSPRVIAHWDEVEGVRREKGPDGRRRGSGSATPRARKASASIESASSRAGCSTPPHSHDRAARRSSSSSPARVSRGRTKRGVRGARGRHDRPSREPRGRTRCAPGADGLDVIAFGSATRAEYGWLPRSHGDLVRITWVTEGRERRIRGTIEAPSATSSSRSPPSARRRRRHSRTSSWTRHGDRCVARELRTSAKTGLKWSAVRRGAGAELWDSRTATRPRRRSSSCSTATARSSCGRLRACRRSASSARRTRSRRARRSRARPARASRTSSRPATRA